MTVFPHGTDGWGSNCGLEGLVTTACRSLCLRRCLGDSDLCKSPFLPLRQSSAFTLSGRGSTCIRSPIFSEMVSAKLYKQKDTTYILDVCSCTHTETHTEQMLISCSGHVHVCVVGMYKHAFTCVCAWERGVSVSHHDHLLQSVVLVWPRVDGELAIHGHNFPVNHFCLCPEADCKVVLL